VWECGEGQTHAKGFTTMRYINLRFTYLLTDARDHCTFCFKRLLTTVAYTVSDSCNAPMFSM